MVHERDLVLGKTHTGKSTWAKREVSALLSAHRIVALDVTDEWSQLGRDREGVDLGPLTARCTAAQLAKNPNLLLAPRLALAVIPDAQTSASAARAFELICRLQKHSKKPLVLVLDEAHTWARYCEALFCDAATLGRHWGGGIALITISQRANRVPLTVRSQSSRIVTFLQDEPPDVEALALKTGPAFAEAASRLPSHEFLEWRDSTAHPTPAVPAAPQPPGAELNA